MVVIHSKILLTPCLGSTNTDTGEEPRGTTSYATDRRHDGKCVGERLNNVSTFNGGVYMSNQHVYIIYIYNNYITLYN